MAAKRFAVVLGSGGARGYAHIGALQELGARGHEVVTISGTSMGALVGAFAASGRLEQLTEWSLALTQRQVLRLMDPSLRGPGVLRADRVIARIGDLLAGSRIEDFEIPFTAVATDLDGRREVWFQRGPADVAIRASIAIPWVIHPVVVNGRLMVDGALINPVPIEPTLAVPSDVTLAVALNGESQATPELDADQLALERRTMLGAVSLGRGADLLRRSTAEILENPTVQRLSARVTGARSDATGVDGAAGIYDIVVPVGVDPGIGPLMAPDPSVAGPERSPAPPDDPGAATESLVRTALPKDLSTFDVINRSLDMMSSMVGRFRLAANPPDVLVQIPGDACRTMDFHRAAELIELGRELTARALDDAGL